MEGLIDNKPVLYGLSATGAFAMLCASQLIPPLNACMELLPLPMEV